MDERALRIKPNPDGSCSAERFGPDFHTPGWKPQGWGAGALGHDGKIYFPPRRAAQVLRIDPDLGWADLVGPHLANIKGSKWCAVEEVAVEEGEHYMYGIPSDCSSVLGFSLDTLELSSKRARLPTDPEHRHLHPEIQKRRAVVQHYRQFRRPRVPDAKVSQITTARDAASPLQASLPPTFHRVPQAIKAMVSSDSSDEGSTPTDDTVEKTEAAPAMPHLDQSRELMAMIREDIRSAALEDAELAVQVQAAQKASNNEEIPSPLDWLVLPPSPRLHTDLSPYSAVTELSPEKEITSLEALKEPRKGVYDPSDDGVSTALETLSDDDGQRSTSSIWSRSTHSTVRTKRSSHGKTLGTPTSGSGTPTAYARGSLAFNVARIDRKLDQYASPAKKYEIKAMGKLAKESNLDDALERLKDRSDSRLNRIKELDMNGRPSTPAGASSRSRATSCSSIASSTAQTASTRAPSPRRLLLGKTPIPDYNMPVAVCGMGSIAMSRKKLDEGRMNGIASRKVEKMSTDTNKSQGYTIGKNGVPVPYNRAGKDLSPTGRKLKRALSADAFAEKNRLGEAIDDLQGITNGEGGACADNEKCIVQ
jgi:hypothetical protein